jgi:hypothetical protein
MLLLSSGVITVLSSSIISSPGLCQRLQRLDSTNRSIRIYKLSAAGAKHLEHEVSSFELMLKGITRVLAPGES